MDENKDKVESIPHIAIITINAIVNQQLPNGQYHPRAVYNDSFSIAIKGNNEKECLEALKARMRQLKSSHTIDQETVYET
jgi:hypothetical protein